MATEPGNGGGGTDPARGRPGRAAGANPAGAKRPAAGPAKPGPTILRPGKAAPPVAGAATGATPPKPATPAPGTGLTVSAKQLMDDHELASRQIAMPELVLSREDAERLAATIKKFGDLTGIKVESVAWAWCSILYNVVSIYGIRAVRALDRVRRERQATPPARPPSPRAPETPRPPAPATVQPPIVAPPPSMNGGMVHAERPAAAMPSTPIAVTQPGYDINKINLGDNVPGLPVVHPADINGPL